MYDNFSLIVEDHNIVLLLDITGTARDDANAHMIAGLALAALLVWSGNETSSTHVHVASRAPRADLHFF